MSAAATPTFTLTRKPDYGYSHLDTDFLIRLNGTPVGHVYRDSGYWFAKDFDGATLTDCTRAHIRTVFGRASATLRRRVSAHLAR